MSGASLPTIPWQFQDSGLKMWQWRNPHFQATITDEGRSYCWEIGDLINPNGDMPRFLAEGRAGDLADADAAVREVIGKSYPPALGYQVYAGPLATTFALASGERVDLGEYNGIAVVVTVRTAAGGEQVIVGDARVVHYELHIDGLNGTNFRIQPSHIMRIVREGGGTAQQSRSDYTGMGRVYRGGVKPGCNGRAGFLPGTVDHTAPARCPVHEDTGLRFNTLPAA